MSVVIPESKTFNRVFTTRADLIQFVEDYDNWKTESNAFTLMCRIEPHKRGFKLISMFFCDNGMMWQMGDDCYGYGEVWRGEFCLEGEEV